MIYCKNIQQWHKNFHTCYNASLYAFILNTLHFFLVLYHEKNNIPVKCLKRHADSFDLLKPVLTCKPFCLHTFNSFSNAEKNAVPLGFKNVISYTCTVTVKWKLLH